MNPYGSITLSLPWLYAALVLIHFWYDAHVQGAFIANGKRDDNVLLTIHALTWTLACSVPLYLVGTLTWEQVFFLLWTHWLMDWTKCHRMPTSKRWPFAFDQAFHLVTLGAVLWQW